MEEKLKNDIIQYQKKYNAQNIVSMIQQTFDIVTGE